MMLRNIPNKYTREMLVKQLNQDLFQNLFATCSATPRACADVCQKQSCNATARISKGDLILFICPLILRTSAPDMAYGQCAFQLGRNKEIAAEVACRSHACVCQV